MKQNELKSIIEKFENINKTGCYFLDLLFLTKEKEPEMVEMIYYYDLFIKNDWMDKDCFIKDPCAILEFLTGLKFKVKKSKVLDSSATYILGNWFNQMTGVGHFVVMDKNDNIVWDSIEDCVTVKKGFKKGYRLFYEY